jgi:hypothetical protein
MNIIKINKNKTSFLGKTLKNSSLASSVSHSSLFSCLLMISFSASLTAKCSAAAETQGRWGAGEAESEERKLGHRETCQCRTLSLLPPTVMPLTTKNFRSRSKGPACPSAENRVLE